MTDYKKIFLDTAPFIYFLDNRSFCFNYSLRQIVGPISLDFSHFAADQAYEEARRRYAAVI